MHVHVSQQYVTLDNSFCPSYFSTAVIKHLDQNNLKGQHLLWRLEFLRFRNYGHYSGEHGSGQANMALEQLDPQAGGTKS